jgi:hypothetical protein
LFDPVPADFREGQSPHSRFWRISAARMPEAFQLPACEAVGGVAYRLWQRSRECHRFGRFTGMMEQGNSPPFASCLNTRARRNSAKKTCAKRSLI